MKDNEKIENNSETGVLRKKRGSILDYHIDEIKKYRELGLNASAIHKIIKNKIPNGGISYDGVRRYIIRKKL